MLGSKSRSICVKFREDDPEQMAAWRYLQNGRGGKTYAEQIADLVKNKGCNGNLLPRESHEHSQALMDIKHICLDIKEKIDRCALSPIGTETMINNTRPEKMPHKDAISDGIENLMRQLSGEDEDE